MSFFITSLIASPKLGSTHSFLPEKSNVGLCSIMLENIKNEQISITISSFNFKFLCTSTYTQNMSLCIG